MKVDTLHVRLFKAFNYDFLRLHDPDAPKRPWDSYKGVDYPYISVPLDKEITCVVGANESGKSQLLDAIGFALGVEVPGPADSCRYSMFFGHDGELSTAQFGLTLRGLKADDVASLSAIGGLGSINASTRAIHIFREVPGQLSVYLDNNTTPLAVTGEDVNDVERCLPETFSIDTKRELPDSVPLSFLIDRSKGGTATAARRVDRFAFVDALLDKYDEIHRLTSAEPFDPAALRDAIPTKPNDAGRKHLEQFELAYHLLVTVGGVAPSMFGDLRDALRKESEGLTTAIVGKINAQLSRALNMPRWWSQDTEFDLQVDTRDFDLVFTIRDRTAAEYMFTERSDGLKYFLSYLVQYLTRLQEDEPPVLLTMDEPDAYLSQQGQQDLLALFQDFVNRDRSKPRQVVFVTHSPFLIDRNRAERIRVLDKGVDDMGTRVVNKASHNHFEPLRSAFGGFVGETTFIGNCNLILEGQVDQIYIAGLCSDASRRKEEPTDYLDLNKITLVAAGGATNVPYMTYLARGRDHDQPAVIVLVDGDGEGDLACELLIEGIRKGKGRKQTQLVNPDFIVQINLTHLPEVATDRPGGAQEIEDLIPLAVLRQAATVLSEELCGTTDPTPTVDDVRSAVTQEGGHFRAMQDAFQAAGSELRIDKLGLGRTVVELLGRDGPLDDIEVLRSNFRQLLKKLRSLQHEAETERRAQGAQKQVRRSVRAFLKQHPDQATRDEVRVLLLDLDRLLDESTWADEVRVAKLGLERDLNLKGDLGDDIADYPGVQKKLEGLLYAADLASESRASEPAAVDATDDSAVDVSNAAAEVPGETVADPNGSPSRTGEA
jgi:energy-coupling factor transporter ATP-binding protein EcfA2